MEMDQMEMAEMEFSLICTVIVISDFSTYHYSGWQFINYVSFS